MLRHKLAFLLSALLIALTSTSANAQNSPTELLLNKARALEARGRIDLAVQAWQQLLMIEPEQQDALGGLARAAKQSGKDSLAKTYLDRLRKINPKNPSIAQIENAGRPEQRRPELEEAAKLAQGGKPEQAVAAYERAFGEKPPSGSWSLAYYDTLAGTPGGWEKATAALEELSRKNPQATEYTLSLGRLYVYRPATRLKGLALLQSIPATSPLSREAQKSWRQALVWENGSPRTESSIRAYLARYPDTEVEKFLVRQRQDSAKELAGGIELQRAYAALKKEDLSAAELNFTQALKSNTRNPGALAGLGFVYMKQKDFDKAVKSFEAAVAVAPGNKIAAEAVKEARFWLNMQEGAKSLDEKRGADAEQFFQKALVERPAHPDALAGYAGALMQRDNPGATIPVLEKLLKAHPDQTEGWVMMVRAKHRTDGAKAALEVARQIPEPVSAKLSAGLGYLTELSALYREDGRNGEAKATFDKAVALWKKAPGAASAGVELQLAGMYLEYGSDAEAAILYRRVVKADPQNLDAWEGLLLAMNRARQAGPALKALEALPPSVHAAAQSRPGFLRAVAALEAAVGNTESAESLLNSAVKTETADGKPASFYSQLQLAQLWIDQGKTHKAIATFSQLAKEYPANTEAYKGWVAALSKEKRYTEAEEVIRLAPSEVTSRLQSDPDHLSVVVGMYRDAGNTLGAVEVLQQASERYKSEGRYLPAPLVLQYGWSLLPQPGSGRELFALLREARTRTDFNPEQRKETNEIWTAWILQSADASVNAGEPQKAVGMLEGGIRMMPTNIKLQRSLSSTLLAAGESKRALSIYKSMGFQGASAADYLSAVGAALTERDERSAASWLNEGLKKFPDEPELLSLAGKQAALRGDFKTAQALWRIALQSMEAAARTKAAAQLAAETPSLANLKIRDAADEVGTLVLTGSPASSETRTQADSAPPQTYRLPWNTSVSKPVLMGAPDTGKPFSKQTIVPASGSDALLGELLEASASVKTEPPLVASLQPVASSSSSMAVKHTSKEAVDQMLEALQSPASQSELLRQLQGETKKSGAGNVDTGLPRQDASPLADLLRSPGTNVQTIIAPSAESGEGKDIMDRIRMVESRNAPYAGLGGVFQSRNGQAGFERMLLQESTLESSKMLFPGVRATIVARSIFADSGAPTGNSEYRFGLLPAGDIFPAQSVSGLGAEAQISSENYGLRFGSNPRGFPVRNLLGGVRIRPAGGPITLMFERDSVKDTILSYAGARDPLSNRVWGGVVADSANATGNWGDERSGAYFNLGFQHLTGRSVQTNQRIDGTMGAYWRIAKVPGGSLGAGVNLFAMHYEKNLRFFTLGQGGYFSPQRFLLFSVPVTWSGKAKQLEYRVATSIGSQSFTEDVSPYFPVDEAIQGKTGPYYPRFSSSGVNYSVDIRTAYQVAENWFLGGYLNANNARFYSLQSVGIFVKYSFRPRPLTSDFSLPSVPDWRGRQPWGLP